MVSNGNKARFWTDSWLGEHSLLQFSIQDINEEEKQWSVSAFVIEENTWNEALFHGKLPTAITNFLESFLPLNQSMEEDTICWGRNASGNFTVKSTYEMLAHKKWNMPDKRWDLAWKFIGPQHVKSFLWLTLKGSQLTNENRYCRHMSTDTIYSICRTYDETLVHVLRDYHAARMVWL